MFLLDTNVVSELRKGPKANAGVVEWLRESDEASVFLSVLVMGELSRGVELLKRRDATAAQRLDRWLEKLAVEYSSRILPIDLRVAQLWGRLNVPDPLSAVDGLLASTALVHGLTLVTRNTVDVERTGVPLLNPFTK